MCQFFHLITEDKEQDIPLFKTALKSTLKIPGKCCLLLLTAGRDCAEELPLPCHNLIVICLKFPFAGNLQRAER